MTGTTPAPAAPTAYDVPVRVPLPWRRARTGRSASWRSERSERALRPPPAQPELAVRLTRARRCRPWAAEAAHLAGARMG